MDETPHKRLADGELLVITLISGAILFVIGIIWTDIAMNRRIEINKPTIGDKRSDLAKNLLATNNKLTAADVSKIVNACYTDEDFATNSTANSLQK
jgi:hypothetical protein